MVAFRLGYNRWETDPERPHAQGPLFRINTGASPRALVIWVLVEDTDYRDLQNEIAVQQATRFPNPSLGQTAVIRFAVARIARGLQDGFFLEPPTHTTLTVPVEEADLPAIRQLLQEKTCTYQIRQGRDLLCSVASADDPSRRGQIGFQTFAPTSRAVCRTCALPDTDYVCSHLMHPEVRGTPNDILQRRQLQNAQCDLGRAEIHNAAKCHAGGHPCWEWLVEPELDRPAIPVSPLTLPEAFDYLDVCWRLAFGKQQPLVRPKNLTGVAMLSLSCATREELSARLSALADMLNSLEIPERFLPAPSTVQPGTLNRLQACLKGHLDAAEYPGCEHAITLLRAVMSLRVSFQHSATARDLPVVCAQLSLPYPFPAWGETWDRIRGTVTEALGVIREALRRYADAGTDGT